MIGFAVCTCFGQKLNAEEIQIHFLALQSPRAATALVPKRPEDRHKDINNREPTKRSDPVIVVVFAKGLFV